MADIELLDKVIAQIEAHPELWNQLEWYSPRACGTAHCVAGWALALTPGVTIAPAAPGFDILMPYRGEDVLEWEADGAHALGLSPSQASALFHPYNSLEQIKAMRDMLAENPGVNLYDWRWERTSDN